MRVQSSKWPDKVVTFDDSDDSMISKEVIPSTSTETEDPSSGKKKYLDMAKPSQTSENSLESRCIKEPYPPIPTRVKPFALPTPPSTPNSTRGDSPSVQPLTVTKPAEQETRPAPGSVSPPPRLPTRSKTLPGPFEILSLTSKQEKLMTSLMTKPRALTLTEMATAFSYLKASIAAYSQKHFSYVLSSNEILDWPLFKLQDDYPEFVANCRYIADGSQYGWRKFFTESSSRPHLVSALLGHLFVEHIFQHTAFGLSDSEVAHIEEGVDKKYINWDGFVRTKLRGETIRNIINGGPPVKTYDSVRNAVDDLALKLYFNLGPLLREDERKPYGGGRDCLRGLSHLIESAAYLALSVRITGATPGRTIIRYTFPTKGTSFHTSSSTIDCVNKARVDATGHHAPNAGIDELQVKMAVFPLIIATSASGPDMLHFAEDPGRLTDEKTGKKIAESLGGPAGNQGAFVSETLTCGAEVYLEWTPLAQPVLEKLSLLEAIAQAKAEKQAQMPQTPTGWLDKTWINEGIARTTIHTVVTGLAVTTLAAAYTGRGPAWLRDILPVHATERLLDYLHIDKGRTATVAHEVKNTTVADARDVAAWIRNLRPRSWPSRANKALVAHKWPRSVMSVIKNPTHALTQAGSALRWRASHNVKRMAADFTDKFSRPTNAPGTSATPFGEFKTGPHSDAHDGFRVAKKLTTTLQSARAGNLFAQAKETWPKVGQVTKNAVNVVTVTAKKAAKKGSRTEES